MWRFEVWIKILKSEIWNQKLEISIWRFEVLRFEVWEFRIEDLRFEIWYLRFLSFVRLEIWELRCGGLRFEEPRYRSRKPLQIQGTDQFLSGGLREEERGASTKKKKQLFWSGLQIKEISLQARYRSTKCKITNQGHRSKNSRLRSGTDHLPGPMPTSLWPQPPSTDQRIKAWQEAQITLHEPFWGVGLQNLKVLN